MHSLVIVANLVHENLSLIFKCTKCNLDLPVDQYEVRDLAPEIQNTAHSTSEILNTSSFRVAEICIKLTCP